MWMIYSRWWKDKGDAGCSSHHMYDINPIKLQKYRFVYKPAAHREALDRKCHTSWILCLLAVGSCLLLLGVALTCTGLLAPGIKKNPTLWIVVGPTCIIFGFLVLVFTVEIVKNKIAIKRRSETSHCRDPENDPTWKGVSDDALRANLEHQPNEVQALTSPQKQTPPTSPPKRIQSPQSRPHSPTRVRATPMSPPKRPHSPTQVKAMPMRPHYFQKESQSSLSFSVDSTDGQDIPNEETYSLANTQDTPTNPTVGVSSPTRIRSNQLTLPFDTATSPPYSLSADSPTFADATPTEPAYSPRRISPDSTFFTSVDSSSEVQYEEECMAVIKKTSN